MSDRYPLLKQTLGTGLRPKITGDSPRPHSAHIHLTNFCLTHWSLGATSMTLTLKRPTGASEAQVLIKNDMYPSIFIRSAQCFHYSFKILFYIFSCNFTNMLQQKGPLVKIQRKLDSNGQSGPHRPRSLSVPLTAFVIDNQMILHSRNMYTGPPGLFAINGPFH